MLIEDMCLQTLCLLVRHATCQLVLLTCHIQLTKSQYHRPSMSHIPNIATMQKPTPNELPILVAPVAEHMQAATAMTEGRRSTVFNHQKVVAESLHALSWMVYTGPSCGMSSHIHALNAFVRLLETSPHLSFCTLVAPHCNARFLFKTAWLAASLLASSSQVCCVPSSSLKCVACPQVHRGQTDRLNF